MLVNCPSPAGVPAKMPYRGPAVTRMAGGTLVALAAQLPGELGELCRDSHYVADNDYGRRPDAFLH
jgi:hypothetical protein